LVADNRTKGWASCPLTQNGFVRVISGSRYPRPRSFGDAVTLFREQIAQPGHVFWPDDISLADPETFNHSRLWGPNRITDIYLLGLAVKYGGRLATLDRSIPLGAVRGAEARHLGDGMMEA
jgi:predicted nucleic acid-binding protein